MVFNVDFSHNDRGERGIDRFTSPCIPPPAFEPVYAGTQFTGQLAHALARAQRPSFGIGDKGVVVVVDDLITTKLGTYIAKRDR